MAKYKRYTDEEKRRALELAEQIGIRAAAKELGITRKTIQMWRNNPTPPKKEPQIPSLDDISQDIKQICKLSTREALKRMQNKDFIEKLSLRELTWTFGVFFDKLIRISGLDVEKTLLERDREKHSLEIEILPMRKIDEK